MNYGRYQIIKKVGEGMMGVVYQAHDPRIDRTIALKVLREDRLQSDEYVQRFLKEAVAIGRISHQNIVAVYDIGQDHDTVYIAMEFLDGCGLDQIIKERRLSFTEIAALGRQIAEALDYAHQKGVVHRDVKPSNIIVLASGSAKLTDFGVARIEQAGDLNKTQVGFLIGSPAYMAPEQVKGQPVDGRADLYALGVILFELATGQKPFSGRSIEVVFSQILQGPRPDPGEINPSIPRELCKVILTCLENDPGRRYQTGAELAAGLQDCLKEQPESASWLDETRLSPSHQQKAQAAPDRRFPWKLLIVLLLVSVSGGIALKLFYFSEPVREISAMRQPEPKAVIQQHAYLDITSTPVGAQLYVDGELRGETPARLTLPLGKHELRLSKAGHYEWEAQMQFDKEQEVPVTINLVSKE